MMCELSSYSPRKRSATGVLSDELLRVGDGGLVLSSQAPFDSSIQFKSVLGKLGRATTICLL